MFHVELRQFPHQARAFNLTREELDHRILGPWVSGAAIELDDQRWAPDRARLTIYEGPALADDQLGMGRGWGNVTRAGEDVTARLLTEAAHPPPVAELKRAVTERCAEAPLTLGAVVGLAGERYPQARVSERLALCEQAVWELLHEGAVELARDGARVAQEGWRLVLLGWEAWSREDVAVRLMSRGSTAR
ncbi:MAG TPA: hypothetical protein VMA77_12285 [Solirubrobacteraceae bacterium]|nr:hypothetical protein [Solirubrobacteraceae bacterium]